MIMPSDKFVVDIMRILGIPKKTTRFSIHFSWDSPVFVDLTYYPEDLSLDEIEERFVLEKVDGPLKVVSVEEPYLGLFPDLKKSLDDIYSRHFKEIRGRSDEFKGT